jgi:hypothetical protein
MQLLLSQILSTPLVAVPTPSEFEVPASRGATLSLGARNYEPAASEIVEMVLTNEILATFFVDPINAELSEEPERKHNQQLVSIDDIRRLIIYHFIKELPAAKRMNQEMEKELDLLPPLLNHNRYAFLHPKIAVAAVNRDLLSYALSQEIQVYRDGSFRMRKVSDFSTHFQ